MKIQNQQIADRVAEFLLECEAVKLNAGNPFSWSSGWKSPIYTDNRVTLSFPIVRTFVKNELVSLISEQFPAVEAIAGVATGGIAQGALVSDKLDLGFLYVRAESKGHGLQNQIEGRLVKGQKIVVVEDLISTGKSSLSAVNALREAGADVLGMVSVFTYGFHEAELAFSDAGIPCFSLSDYPSLVTIALRQGLISDSDLPLLISWRKNPAQWGK
ncbi:MAG TPA: orotate phosphoribosyltransferase [Catalimonadaceae bacterium]|nr:orotate phosphoribosyltransferase [Catalimonadaceae bacterium]